MSGFWFAILLTTVAGLATVGGSVISLAVRKPSAGFMTVTLGFSAGVMVLISFVELLPQGTAGVGFLAAHLLFFAGMGVTFLIDVLIPHTYGGETVDETGVLSDRELRNDRKLLRTGLFVAWGVGIHNFPEGMATFVTALADPKLGLALAVAIAVHNIPEGIAVAAPVYAATGSRAKAFWWSAVSGLTEPVGALLAAVVLLPFLSPGVLSSVLAVVAGMMVYVALDELLPAAHEYGREHLAILGVISGMLVMAASLYLLQ